VRRVVACDHAVSRGSPGRAHPTHPATTSRACATTHVAYPALTHDDGSRTSPATVSLAPGSARCSRTQRQRRLHTRATIATTRITAIVLTSRCGSAWYTPPLSRKEGRGGSRLVDV